MNGDMKTESVRYDADGLQMIGHFAYDENDSKKRPAVLVFPEAFGLGDHAKKRTERIAAELGYAAACDLHDEQKVSEAVTSKTTNTSATPRSVSPSQ